MKKLVNYLRSKLLLKLWIGNMIIVTVAILFLWIVQVRFFEPNYLNSTMEDLYHRVRANADEMKDVDDLKKNTDNNPLHFHSKTVAGTVLLVDGENHIISAYNSGMETNSPDMVTKYAWLLKEAPQAIQGQVYKKITCFKNNRIITMAIPAEYQGNKTAIVFSHTLSQIEPLLALNRQQLLTVSIIMFVLGTLVAFFLAQHFTKPILSIESTVNKMTSGDLAIGAPLERQDELGTLSESVVALGQQLERVEVLRKEVIANVSHELRAPLSLIQGYSEMIRDVTGDEPETRNENLDLIITETQRLSKMVNDIMDYSKMQAGYSEVNIEPTDLIALLERTIATASLSAAEYQQKITLISDKQALEVQIDSSKITQVIQNLLNNAINHSANYSEIMACVIDNDEFVRVSIENPGEPIPEEMRELIWERYQQVQHQGGHKEGTGIGLAIVRSILEAHHMNFGMDTSEGFNKFWFEIMK